MARAGGVGRNWQMFPGRELVYYSQYVTWTTATLYNIILCSSHYYNAHGRAHRGEGKYEVLAPAPEKILVIYRTINMHETNRCIPTQFLLVIHFYLPLY